MNSTSKYHRDYPFLPAAASSSDGDGDGDGFYIGEPRNPAAGADSTDVFLFLAVPAGWLVRLAAFVGELVASAILGLVYPVAALIGWLRAVPAAVASLLRRASTGLLAAACTFAVLAAAFVVSLVLGFALVRHWVAEPVTARHPLYFDYTEAQPSAAVALGGGAAALPAGHAVRVSMALLLPDSYHNRHIGVFQIKSEAISVSGITIASTTQPYLIKYKSSPVRLIQTALLCVPLTMGIRSESQDANLKLLHYREGHGRHKRTVLIRVMLQPRAMTVHLPQVYKAEIVVQTTLPWTKELVRALKWTLCVWVSLCVYVFILVLAMICWSRSPSAFSARDRRLYDHQVIENSGLDMGDSGERSDKELYGGVGVKWKQRIRKRKAQPGTLQGDRMELKFTEGSTSGVAMDGE
ncbi:seipin-1 [Oryza glaberrima]|uniref:Seipin n=2 Tax=Oryza TaxID=4527 RepID=A0A0D3HRG3_9ORYZ|nr:seipin-1 [Oryza glaberrima]CBX24466.1 hypothetical_protein [Oryza glaberrima]